MLVCVCVYLFRKCFGFLSITLVEWSRTNQLDLHTISIFFGFLFYFNDNNKQRSNEMKAKKKKKSNLFIDYLFLRVAHKVLSLNFCWTFIVGVIMRWWINLSAFFSFFLSRSSFTVIRLSRIVFFCFVSIRFVSDKKITLRCYYCCYKYYIALTFHWHIVASAVCMYTMYSIVVDFEFVIFFLIFFFFFLFVLMCVRIDF